jgi:hypothetical protein
MVRVAHVLGKHLVLEIHDLAPRRIAGKKLRLSQAKATGRAAKKIRSATSLNVWWTGDEFAKRQYVSATPKPAQMIVRGNKRS